MNLINCELRMGRVIDVEDPENLGRVKVEIFGYFDGCPADEIPWSHILFRPHTGYHRTYKNDEFVYVLLNKENVYEYYHLDISDQNDALKEILNDSYENTEVVICREGTDANDNKLIQFFYSDGQGFIQRFGDTWIKMKPEGNIQLITPWDHRTIDICEDSLSLGSEKKSAEPCVLGDQNEDALNKIHDMFDAIKNAAQGSPYTMPIATALNPLIPPYKQQIPKTKSKECTLD